MNNVQFKSTVPAMRILEHEHQYLSHLMNEWHAIVLNMQSGRYVGEQAKLEFAKLRALIQAFKTPYSNHTDKEEKFFFPMLGQYIGFEQGPIMPIEQEHGEVLAYLDHFLHHSEGEQHTLQDMINMTRDAGEAFEILTIHFVKEESVLFPMTAQLMSKRDQERLYDQLHTLIDE